MRVAYTASIDSGN